MDEPKRWGVLGGTFWAFVAFFLPQFAIVPFVAFFDALPIQKNTELFVLQGLTQLATILLIWLVVSQLYNTKLKDIGLGKLDMGLVSWSVIAFPLYFIAATVLSNVAASLFGIDIAERQNIGYSNPSGFELTLTFIALVCLAPFVEEVLFRGFLFKTFRRTFGFWVGAVAVSLLFAVAHGQVNVGIDVFVLSMFLCYLREKTDSLWPSIAMHSLKNLVAFVVLFIIKIN